MKPVDKKILLFSLKLMVLLSLAFSVMIFAPQHAHHLLLVIAATMLVSGWGSLLQYREQANWIETTASLKRISECEEEVAVSEVGRVRYFYPEIDYEYAVDDRSFESSVVCFEKESVWMPEVSDWGDPIPREDRWWSSLEPGDELPVYVNPRNPAEAVLIRDAGKARRSHHLALLTGGALLALAWLLLTAAI